MSLVFVNIKTKFVAFLSIMLLSACVTLSFIFAYHTLETFEDDLQKRGLSEAANLAIESKLGALTEDSEILMPLLLNKLNNPDVLYIEVININADIITSVYRYPLVSEPQANTVTSTISIENPSSKLDSSLFYVDKIQTKVNYFKITAPIYTIPLLDNQLTHAFDELSGLAINPLLDPPTGDQQLIGKIQIGFSLSGLENKKQAVLEFIILITLSVLAVAILLAYVLARRALTPLLTMSNIATQIAVSDLKNVSFKHNAMVLTDPAHDQQITLAPRSYDEIGLLTEAFIKMSRKLQGYGENLELQVQNRTEELSHALHLSRELKSAVEAANEQLQLFRRCLEETSDFVLIIDQEGLAHTCNLSFLNQNNYTAEQIKGHKLNFFFAPAELEALNKVIWPAIQLYGEWHGETQFNKRSGQPYPVDLSITSVTDDHQNIIAYVCISRDITLKHGQQKELMRLASRDSLTGLLNRRRFMEELDQEITSSEQNSNELALIWLDLDQFKNINDSMGHQAGDELLIKLARSLEDLTRDTDIVARLGGDEFAILLSNTSIENARKGAERLLEGIRSNVTIIDEQPIRVMTSIGIAVFPDHATNSHDLLACADIALYKSKNAGRNQFNFYQADDSKTEQYGQHRAWNQRLWDALDENRFLFYQQAIVDVSNGQIKHYELLLRMQDEKGVIVLPGAFITFAERSGMINDIDRWVIHNAIKLYGQTELRQNQCKVTVNLSAKALSDEKFPAFVELEFSNADVDPKMFVLEITENSAIADLHKTTRFINRLKQIGCEFALDDFGIGFASLSHVKNLNINYLKIDGSFIKDIDDHANRGIVEAMIRIAQSLNIKSIAEWVESKETMTILEDLGIDYVQGYYLGKPEPLRYIEEQQKGN